MTPFILDDFLPYQLAILSNRISTEFSRRYSKDFGISISEWRVVAHLSQAEKVSVREVFQQVEMDKSKISRAAAKLEKAGYVLKKPSALDRRLIELSLTPKGRDMASQIGAMGREYHADLLKSLGPVDPEDFDKAIKALLGRG